jgi:hypothetical protein
MTTGNAYEHGGWTLTQDGVHEAIARAKVLLQPNKKTLGFLD